MGTKETIFLSQEIVLWRKTFVPFKKNHIQQQAIANV